MFDTAPIEARRKGWQPRPDGSVKIVSGWERPEQVGAGADFVRDDWKSEIPDPSPAPAPETAPVTDFTPPTDVGYPSRSALSTPTSPSPTPTATPTFDAPTGGSGAPPRSFPSSEPVGGASDPPPQNPNGPSLDGIVDFAKTAIGSKYIWGGPGGRSNFDPKFVGSDCSGFTAWAYYNATGIKLPAFTGSIREATKPISRDGAKPGDIVMWGMQNSSPAEQHVGIYAGNGMWIHDSSVNPTGGVALTPLWSGVEFRRVPGVNVTGAPAAMMQQSDRTETNPASTETNPASLWAQFFGGDKQPEPAQQAEINPASLWTQFFGGKVGSGAAEDDTGGGPDDNPIVPLRPEPVLLPEAQMPITPLERHVAETQIGRHSSDDLTQPLGRQNATPPVPAEPDLPRVQPAPAREDSTTVFDLPILRPDAPEKLHVQMPQAQTQQRPLAEPAPFQVPEQYWLDGQPETVDLPRVKDPNEGIGEIGKAVAGAPTNPFALHAELQDAATKAVVPEPVRDAPVLGGLVEQALDPAWMEGGIGAAVTEAGVGLAGRAAVAAAPRVKDAVKKYVPDAVHMADAVMGSIGRAGADAILSAIETAQPGLGRQLAHELPAQVDAKYSIALANAVGSSALTAAETPEDDPNRLGKIIGFGAASGLGTAMLLHHYPEIRRGWNEILAPTKNLPPHVQAIFANLAHGQEAGRVLGDMWQQRGLEALADKPKNWKPWEWGMPKAGTGMDHWTSAAAFERTKTFGPSMTPAQQAFADDMWHYGERTRKEGKKLGIIEGDVTSRPGVQAYFPHMWQENWNAVKTAATKRGLNPHDFFKDARKHDTLSDGVKAGLSPVNSLSEAWSTYVRRYETAKAKKEFAQAIRKSAGPDWARVGTPGKGGVPAEWVRNKPEWGMPTLQDVSVHPDLAKAIDNVTTPSALRQNMLGRAILNGFAEIKHALFAPSAFHLASELRQVIAANGKEGVPIFAKSLYYTVNPGAYRKFVLANADGYVRAANAGVTMMRSHPAGPDIGQSTMNPIAGAALRAGWSGTTTGLAAYTQAKQQLEPDEVAIHNGLMAGLAGSALGIAGGPISRSLWERSVPSMKYMTWETLASRYGEKPAGEFVNEVFGGQNLEAIARSKTVQDVLRLLLLAPDWQEGWIRQIGNGLRGFAATPHAATHGGQTNTPVATANAWYWTNTAVTSAFTLEGLNLAFNGHFTNENGPNHELTLEMTGLYDKMGWDHHDEKGRPYRVYMDILGPYRGLIQAPLDPAKFVSARAGLGPSAIGEVWSGKDYAGRPIVPPGEDPAKGAALRVAHLLSRLAPASGSQLVQTWGKEPTPISATSAITGMRTSRMSPVAQAMQERDKKLQQLGLTPEMQAQAAQTYANLLAQTDRKFQQAINQKGKTHAQIDAELMKVSHPDRPSIEAAQLPPNLANDPARQAEIAAVLRDSASFGTASSSSPADILPESGIDVQAVTNRYWTPKPGIENLSKQEQDNMRAKELAQMAVEYSTDTQTLLDAIKASSRGMDMPPPVPGIPSAEIDRWVSRWSAIASDDPVKMSADRRNEIDKIAQEFHLPPETVWSRIKLRRIPAAKPTELEQSRDKALDVLFAAHDTNQHPKYANPDGTPMGGPEQWASFDARIAGAKTARDRQVPEVKALIDARNAAAANQHKYILNSPGYNEYQRWFGVGRNMNETQWQKYQSGGYPHYTDTSDPQETLNRDHILEQYKAATPAERRLQMVTVSILGRPQTVPLETARRHIQHQVKAGWAKALGVDDSGSGGVSSGG